VTNGFSSTIFGGVETDRLLQLLLARQLETDLFEYLDVQNPDWYAALLKASLQARRRPDDPSMERLRNIVKLLKLWRQKAAFESLIYAAPHHSRFEHTLGLIDRSIAFREHAPPNAHYAKWVPWHADVDATYPLASPQAGIVATTVPSDAITISILLPDRVGHLDDRVRCEITFDRRLFDSRDYWTLAPDTLHRVSERKRFYIADDTDQGSFQLRGVVSRFDDQQDVDDPPPADAESPADDPTLIEVALTLMSLGRTQQRLLEAMNEYEAELHDFASWAHSFMASPHQANAPEGTQ